MISIRNLHFSYRRRPVFSGLSLQLQQGHIYGLLGKNGTGKSTLLRNIAGLLFPGKGSIDVMDSLLQSGSRHFCRKCSWYPKNFTCRPFTSRTW